MKLRQGNVFTNMCQEFKNSVHRRWGVSVPACTTGHITRGRGSLSRGVSVRGSLSRGISVWGFSVQGGSLSQGSLSGGLYRGGSLSRGVSVRETPPDRDPPSYGNKRVVCILLEYILVVE